MTDRKLRVFLCHASQDKPVVRELYNRLLAEGWIDPWLDEEKLLPGQDWDMEIEKAVESADVVIVCLSNNSVSKEGYIQKELKLILDIALEKIDGAIFIIPLRLDSCQIPRRLRSWHYVDYSYGVRKKNYLRLMQSLRVRYVTKNNKVMTGYEYDVESDGAVDRVSKSNNSMLAREHHGLEKFFIQIKPYIIWYTSIACGILPYMVFTYIFDSWTSSWIQNVVINYSFFSISILFIALWQRKILLSYRSKASTWIFFNIFYLFIFFLSDMFTVDAWYRFYIWLVINVFWYFVQLIVGPFFVLRNAIIIRNRLK